MVNTKNKFIITLENIDVYAIHEKYGLKDDEPENFTKISELRDKETKQTMSFFGTSKQLHKCNISMINIKNEENITNCKYNCFWCRNSFCNMAIGCPITHSPAKNKITYTSSINQSNYSIEENDHENKKGSFYTTDGAFCSFNCCVAYIQNNESDPLYEQSYVLLIKLYNEMFNNNITSITPAPHWRILKEYGGHLSVNEFRDGFDKVEYQNHGYMKDITSGFTPITHLYEKKLKFLK